MASDGVKEGVRRLAKTIDVLAWIWLVLCLSLGALSAWGQRASPTYNANLQQVSNASPLIDTPEITSAPSSKAVPASAKPSIDQQIDPSKVQWDAEPKGESALDVLIARDMKKGVSAESAPASRALPVAPPAKDYLPSYFLAAVGVAGFAILRALAWILAGFAK